MIVIDVETTGTEPGIHSLLSVGAVDFSAPDRRFYGECRAFAGAHVMEEALVVNGFSRESLADPAKQSEGELVAAFLAWAETISEKTLAGHNPSFDRDFLKAAAARAGLNWSFAHRTLDLHSITYYHMTRAGKPIPTKNGHSALNSDACHEYCGLPPEPKPHNALNGALWEAESLSRLLRLLPLTVQFEKMPIPWRS